MGALFKMLIKALLVSSLDHTQNLLNGLVDISLYPEYFMAGFFGESAISGITTLFFEIGITLIITKFIAKGFSQYVLWTNGDPDADPLQLLIGFFRALALAINFHVLYMWLANTITELTNQILNEIGVMDDTFTVKIVEMVAPNFVTGILALIFFIMLFVLYIQFLTKGLEILILRIGFPIACVGSMDANDGVLKAYSKKILQSVLAVLVQVALAQMGVALMINNHIFWGLATMIMAIKTPKFLQEFLLVSDGYGAMGAVYNASRSVSVMKQIIKKKP
jgi:hypothetical protein